MGKELITLPSGGSIPGIPGDHAPGTYEVDYQERTITPVQQQAEQASYQTEPLPSEPPPLQGSEVEQTLLRIEDQLHVIEQHNDHSSI